MNHKMLDTGCCKKNYHSLSSCDETTDHLETLYETESLKDGGLYQNLHERLQTLGKKINLFIQSVEKEHKTNR